MDKKSCSRACGRSGNGRKPTSATAGHGSGACVRTLWIEGFGFRASEAATARLDPACTMAQDVHPLPLQGFKVQRAALLTAVSVRVQLFLATHPREGEKGLD